MIMKTDMQGFKLYISRNPRKRLDGYFIYQGHKLSHEEVIRVVNFAVERGYRTEADIPEEELDKLLKKGGEQC